MPTINPFIADAWLHQRLTSHPDVQVFCEGRVAPARDGFEYGDFLSPEDIADGKEARDCYPFIIYGGTGTLDEWGGDLTLQADEVLVRAVVREDLTPPGVDFETYAAQGYKAISNALRLVEGVVVDLGNGETGTVHGCQILPAKHKHISGERGQRECEMGLWVSIVSS